MATTQQGKVTDFFSARKRSSANPSKRRKVEISTSQSFPTEVTNTPNKTASNKTIQPIEETLQEKRTENVFSPLQTRAARKSKSVSQPSSTKKPTTRRRKAQVKDPAQKLISEVLSQTKAQTEEATITEDVTSSWDDHDGEQQTPTKATPAANTKGRKRTRGETTNETAKEESTPEKRVLNIKAKTERKSKKKLNLVEDKEEKLSQDVPAVQNTVDPVEAEPAAQAKPKTTAKSTTKMMSSVQEALEKCKNLKTTSKKRVETNKAEEMKDKLAKVTSIGDLKERLAKMKETRDKLKTPVPSLKQFDEIKVEVDVPSETKPKVPAYEKFHHLATPSAPTLSLPYKYKMLAEQFRGMDTVISMLHNRNEVCTFSKLKVAVQELTKKNFEKNHIGKIKTVYPSAYKLRQEKGLKNPAGFKESGYQLTVEAQLDEENAKGVKPTFKASTLVRRRENFHNSLVHIVKQHHKDFLSKLSRPLTIPDEKITRWHPKFPLDEVPDILESPLPQAPDVQTYQTAKDVLNQARGKVMPKVEAALVSTVKEEQSNVKTEPVLKQESKPVTGALKGIPQSLLEKIRAREAANTASSLMRDPKEEKRTSMIKRLPDIMRIVRSAFVTEKKPSLTQDAIITRIQDSYRSELAAGDIQSHIDLCVELLPEWMKVIQIKKGKYYKIDRNIDLQTLTDKINNILKAKK